jgi:HSP20 family protein
MDISETERDIKVRALLPGVRKEDVSISLHQNVLSISGEKRLPEPTQGARVLRQEQFQGRFQRTLRLNRPVEADRIRASLKAGVLTLTLPLKEEARPRQIQVAVD